MRCNLHGHDGVRRRVVGDELEADRHEVEAQPAHDVEGREVDVVVCSVQCHAAQEHALGGASHLRDAGAVRLQPLDELHVVAVVVPEADAAVVTPGGNVPCGRAADNCGLLEVDEARSPCLTALLCDRLRSYRVAEGRLGR
ncbi:transglutaminase family protein [Babesia caballi]|uniref:Transglutaminase family protein n=1 Tax=Babesia caballi TaxID=5871 RepID=A0AAV4LST7_BABCB|nr:transglutaminase family protein [Babesia caballi]